MPMAITAIGIQDSSSNEACQQSVPTTVLRLVPCGIRM